ncbi:NirA family protein [Granulicella tundricola]|uniref:Precorrin-3B synthase n=1 Tax=Granulicella tundricola (strain ATCC BAA-1859 / DSM 23138 / MP5ACTX9) TaxID=1198114 RepID=E8X513_GRATM|nr:NirA family protein [Granulicella tundricola]ADW67205.1 precorrin-3B synthase [Granulicella tundricola MP5ACTX9]
MPANGPLANPQNALTAPMLESAGDETFSVEQKQYLEGFFAGVIQRMPFVGHTAAGQITAEPTAGTQNLAATFHGTLVEDLCREELWKYERNPLDAWDELLSHSKENMAPNPENTYRFKFHGFFYVSPAQDSFMLRLRVPGAVLTSRQMRGLAEMADEWGAGRCDLTTRSNVQIRDFQPKHLVPVLNKIAALGMSSRGSGADNIRNITASPLSGIDPRSLLDVRPHADALAQYILNSRDLFGLPRKFNVAFDDGGTISAVADTNDIGFQAVRVSEGQSLPAGVYFRVLLCGITGHRQFATDAGVILKPHEAVAVAAAMIRVFAENGDRTDRKKARLKYLVDRWGMERFLEEAEKLLAFPLLRLPLADCEARGPIERAGHIGTHAQVQPGLSYIGVSVPVGRLPVDQMRAVAGIAEEFGTGEIRLTVWQNLILPNIPEARLPAAQAALTAAGLKFTAGPVLSGTVACTGNQGCRYAASDTKTHAVALARTLDERFPQLTQPINLHVTGCNNSCAQHYIGDIGLMGTKVEGEEGYVVSLGGGSDADQGIAREFIAAIKFADLPPVMELLLGSFVDLRSDENETFLAFTRRHSIEELRAFAQVEAE